MHQAVFPAAPHNKRGYSTGIEPLRGSNGLITSLFCDSNLLRLLGMSINTFRPYHPCREREPPARAFQGDW